MQRDNSEENKNEERGDSQKGGGKIMVQKGRKCTGKKKRDPQENIEEKWKYYHRQKSLERIPQAVPKEVTKQN